MMTTKGEIPDADLRKNELCEDVPCGTCVTTQWFFGDELVRQDIEVRVKEGLIIEGSANL